MQFAFLRTPAPNLARQSLIIREPAFPVEQQRMHAQVALCLPLAVGIFAPKPRTITRQIEKEQPAIRAAQRLGLQHFGQLRLDRFSVVVVTEPIDVNAVEAAEGDRLNESLGG